MKDWFYELRLALGFLTILPLAPAAMPTPRQLARSMAWYPLVGVGIGALLLGADRLLARAFPRGIEDGLLLLLLVLISGALHLDGVADSADGLYGIRDRDERLRIMKDSRIGAMGVVALVLLLLLKYLALVALPLKIKMSALLLAPALGRGVAVYLAACTPYARPEGGTGQGMVEHAGRRELACCVATLLPLALWLGGVRGLLVASLVLLAAELFRQFAKARLGGVTGDLLGAAIEGGEVLTLLLLSSHWYRP